MFVAASLAMLIIPAVAEAQTPAPEMRGMWVSRFEWPDANESVAKSNIDNIMQTLAFNNYNAVFFQVRGQCDVHYPSPYEPWSNIYGWTDPGWDPLAYAIQKAHENGLEFHAYVNTHTMVQPVPPAVTTPQHMYNVHGPAASPENSWLIRTSPTAPAGIVDGYYWISPGIPAASAWTRQAIMHIVKNYDVDGVHFDRIRTPGAAYSHDPITEARFTGDGNPDNLSFDNFMRSQITRDLRNIYGEVAYHKPHVKLSAAPFGIVYMDSTTHYQGNGTESYHQWYQDSWGWLNSHVLDFMVPQIYWEVGSAHPFEKLLQDWMERSGGRHVVAGSTTNNGNKYVSAMLSEHQQTRLLNSHGHTIFSYGSMGAYWNDLRTQRFQQPAPLPEMPWKTSPSSGIITGYVVDGDGNAVVDARINLAGDSYNYLSAADGFFTVLDVAPGLHSLAAVKADVGEATAEAVSVSAGGVTSLTLILKNSAGRVALDRDRYAPDGTVEVLVTDGDLAGESDITVLLSSTSETTSEALLLSADGLGGKFRGTIQLASAAPAADDGIVQVQDGDMLHVSYTDTDDGSGNSVIVTDYAVIDGTGPVISNVTTATLSSISATITFETDEPASVMVRYGPACDSLTELGIGTATGTFHSVPLTGLTPEATYYYHVEAIDEVGNSTTDDNGGDCYQFSTPLISIGLNETFENGLNGWQGTGLWRYIDHTDPCASANSPTRSWYYGLPSCTYNTPGASNTGRLTSPDFVVPAGATLRFWSREQHENFPNYDTRRVFVRHNDTDHLVYASTNNANAWYQVPAVNLSAYANQVVNLVFEFNTVDAISNSFAGWYVDDVVVAAVPPQKAVNPFPADGAGAVNSNAQLSWTNNGPTGTFTVHFGNSNPPPPVATTASTSYDPGPLSFDTQYYWRIDTTVTAGVATGDLWTFSTAAPPEIAINPGQFSFLLEPGTVATTTVLVTNNAPPGASNLILQATAETDEGTSYTEIIGTGALTVGGQNRYRGCIYEATSSGFITELAPRLGFTGAVTLNYVVFESTSLSGTYNRIFSSLVAQTGTGIDFYSSGNIAVPVTAGRYYIVATGWSGTVVSYPYSSESLPVSYGFGIQRNGFGIDSYPLGVTAVNANNVNTYQQRVRFNGSWLGATVPAVPAVVAPQSAVPVTLTVSTHGLTDGLYNASAITSSNDPIQPLKTAAVALQVKSRPAAVGSPVPADGATGQDHELLLAWDPGTGADSFNLHLGTVNPPPFLTSRVSPDVPVSGLPPLTLHYWRVDSENIMGVTQGDVYSFTTGPAVSVIVDWALY